MSRRKAEISGAKRQLLEPLSRGLSRTFNGSFGAGVESRLQITKIMGPSRALAHTGRPSEHTTDPPHTKVSAISAQMEP
jgi:hypothetical protein